MCRGEGEVGYGGERAGEERGEREGGGGKRGREVEEELRFSVEFVEEREEVAGEDVEAVRGREGGEEPEQVEGGENRGEAVGEILASPGEIERGPLSSIEELCDPDLFLNNSLSNP